MLSRMIGKMEAAGLLMRSAHPDDGRAVVVAATAEGIACMPSCVTRTRLFAEYLGQLPETRPVTCSTPYPPSRPSANGCVRPGHGRS